MPALAEFNGERHPDRSPTYDDHLITLRHLGTPPIGTRSRSNNLPRFAPDKVWSLTAHRAPEDDTTKARDVYAAPSGDEFPG